MGAAHRSLAELPAHLPAALAAIAQLQYCDFNKAGDIIWLLSLLGRVSAARFDTSAPPSRFSRAIATVAIVRKASGSAFVSALAVLTTTLKITGNVKYYDSKADSGSVCSRGFCSECGARLFGKSTGLPHLAIITAEIRQSGERRVRVRERIGEPLIKLDGDGCLPCLSFSSGEGIWIGVESNDVDVRVKAFNQHNQSAGTTTDVENALTRLIDACSTSALPAASPLSSFTNGS
jgi:hypothetical protein